MHDVRVAKRQDALGAPLAANTALLVSTKDSLWRRLLEAVHEDAAGLQAEGNLLSMCNILTPNAGAEASVGVVGALDDLLLVAPRLTGNDGTCTCQKSAFWVAYVGMSGEERWCDK